MRISQSLYDLRTEQPPPLSQESRGPWVRTHEPLLWLAGAGQERLTHGDHYYYDSRKRSDASHLVLQLTLEGAGFHERSRRRVALPEGAAFFDRIPGPFIYGGPAESAEVYDQVYVSLRGPAADAWFKTITGAFGHVLHFGPSNPIAPMMLAIVRQFRDRTLPDRYSMSSQLYHLIMNVLSALNRSRVALAPRVTAAFEIIERRGADPSFNVAELARELHCSREYLGRQFRASTGVGPLDYLTQHRLRLAAQALRQSSEKLDAIAPRAGFTGANYLCRVFRKQYGVTPMEFRRRPWML